MRIQNIELHTSMEKILDQLIDETKKRGYNFFSLGYKNTENWLMVQCPYHKYGQERNPSAGFSKEDGFFNCFTCKEKHPLPSVITDILGVNGRAWLLENFEGVATEDRDVDFMELPDRHVSFIPKYLNKSVLDKYRTKHPYMYKRKLTDEIIDKFDIGYDPNYILDIKDKEGNVIGHKDIGGCLTFPIKDEFGNLLFIAVRSVNTKFFHYPNDVDKPLFGLYEIYQEIKAGKDIDTVYVCESMINALTLWTYGKYAIALNGTGSKEQIEMLKKTPFRELILALDPDFAGKKGTEKIKNALERHKIISELVYKDDRDINELSREEFESLEIKDNFGF